MKKLYLLLYVVALASFAQDKKDTNAFDFTYLTGNVLPHTPDLYHLTGHPEAVMFSFSRQTHGAKEWHSAYNFPDYGGYFLYQNFNNTYLGESYAVGMHYNFYFLNRNLQFKLAQGFAYVTNPYDKENNSKNKALGTSIVDNTNIGLSYKKENLFHKFGVQAGVLFTHYSNGRTKSPNSGINTYLLSLGINYDVDGDVKNVPDTIYKKKDFREPLRYNIVLRSGVNESPVIGSGQYPFYHIGFYVDKRVGRKSAIQLGSELFLTEFFKDYIRYRATAYPEENIDPTTDYKRVGLFIGHELFVNRISLETQMGYYIYEPYKNDISVYNRVGMKYYFTKKIFAGFTIKTHLFLAEALEFGVGVRL
ncbi:MAG: acyloxyacyl hydrolase [Bacteroidota bacterium]